MVDAIDPFSPPNTSRPPTVDTPQLDDAAAPDDVEANRPPDAPPAPEEETDEQWMHRFLEENAHLARPRPERPPAPPPSPWDGPPSSWKVPDHLSMRHPRGGYMAMALLSRTMDDLDEVTKDERAATYEEVDKYFGHALIAEGLVPFTYTADQAIWWWKSGGYKVLGGDSVDAQPMPSDTTSAHSPDQDLDANLHDEEPTGVSHPSPSPLLRAAAGDSVMTNASTLDETLDARRDPLTRSPIDMNAKGMVIDDVVDSSQAGTDSNTPAVQQKPGGMPAPQPAAPPGNAPAVPGATGNGGATQPTTPAHEAAQPIRTPISLGTRRTSINNIPNRITGAYLPQNDFILSLKNGLLSSVEPDVTKTSRDLTTPERYDEESKKAQAAAPVANVDVSADPDAITFVHAIASTLTATKVGGAIQAVEKYIMVEWDSTLGGYVVTGIKILPAGGGYVEISPRLPETQAARRNKARPRAFVVHTHVVDTNWDEKPGPGDAKIIKS